MLLQFNITNVMSFKEEVILDLTASSDNSHEENMISFDKSKVLPTIAIYGANASGKSNLFKALTAAIIFVRNSNNMQVNTKIEIPPFLLDSSSKNEKRRFDFIYEYNGLKYEYGFTADEFKVYEEYLYEYSSSKPSLIFERYDVNKYNYTSNKRRILKQYEAKNTDNKLFLATATAWNCKETENAFLWFAEAIDTYDQESIEAAMADELENSDPTEMRDFSMKWLKQADFNISDYDFSVKQGDLSNIPLPPGMTFEENTIFNGIKEWKLDIFHEIDENGKKVKYSLPFYSESNGTRTFFAYAPFVYKALKNGKTIVIDEIDKNLHPMLVKYIVNIFNDLTINKNGAQLIFNTHDITLLDLDFLRRDQIYFVEKDNKTGISELYSLSDFSARKTEKIQKGYMQGRYGAIPNIGVGSLEW